jgi:hypothetical protein
VVVVSCGLLWAGVRGADTTQNPPGATPCEFDSRLGHLQSDKQGRGSHLIGVEPRFFLGVLRSMLLSG